MAIITTGLTATIATVFDKRFLERAKLQLTHGQFAQKRGIPSNGGTTIIFNRHSIPAVATTALTEAANPASADVSSTQVCAVLLEYGSYELISSLYSRVSVDVKLLEQVSAYGQYMGETIDVLIRTSMVSGSPTQQIASAATAATSIAATDILDAAEVRKAVRTLKKNKALQLKGTKNSMVFGGIVGPEGSYDLQGDSTWQATQQYVQPDPMKVGLLGTFQGVDFVETNNTYITATPAYATWIMGSEAIGVVSIDSEDVITPGNGTLIIKDPGPNSTNDPLNRASTIGWQVTFVPKVLNTTWLVQILHGATA